MNQLVDSFIKTFTNKPFGLSLSKACFNSIKRFDKLTANGNCSAGTICQLHGGVTHAKNSLRIRHHLKRTGKNPGNEGWFIGCRKFILFWFKANQSSDNFPDLLLSRYIPDFFKLAVFKKQFQFQVGPCFVRQCSEVHSPHFAVAYTAGPFPIIRRLGSDDNPGGFDSAMGGKKLEQLVIKFLVESNFGFMLAGWVQKLKIRARSVIGEWSWGSDFSQENLTALAGMYSNKSLESPMLFTTNDSSFSATVISIMFAVYALLLQNYARQPNKLW